jgi:large subunit ribosomal protein L32
LRVSRWRCQETKKGKSFLLGAQSQGWVQTTLSIGECRAVIGRVLAVQMRGFNLQLPRPLRLPQRCPALLLVRSPSFMASVAFSAVRFGAFQVVRSFLPILPLPALAIPAAIHLNLPSLLPGIFESILRAVPKKKQSHSRKRMRQLAGKALQDVTALNRCSACGRAKRSHLLCEHCVRDVKNMWLGKGKKGSEGEELQK